jgi:D-alanyl-D-alanine carboxypeptidase/D-alanyl-D-alanine carboxypeptidase (penicillin-binding protein 5/6)
LYDGAVGVKTGFTKKSGRCLVSSAERNGVLLICVTLDAPDDWHDHTELLNSGFSEIKKSKLSEFTKINLSIPVIGGESETAEISANDMDIISMPDDDINVRYDIPRYIPAGAKKGDLVGKIKIYKNGKLYKEADLTLDNSVKKADRRGLFSKPA